MKKFLLVLTLLFTALPLFGFSSYSAAGNIPPATNSENAIWYEEVGDNAYINIQYLTANGWVKTNNANYLTPIPNAGFIWLFMPQVLTNPNNDHYNFLYVVEISGGREITRFTAPVDEIMIISGEPQNADEEAGNMYQALLLYDNQTNDEIYKIHLSNAGKQVKIYWAHVETQEINNFNDLPLTDGNPTTNKGGQFGLVDYSLNDRTATFLVKYGESVYSITKIFENIEFLQGTNTALYYTDGEDRFMYFTYDDGDPLRFGAVENNELASTWGGYSVWNMTQNDVKIYKKILTYTIVDQDSKGNLWAYFYTPTIAVDELLSVTVSFEYRYHYVLGNPSAWQSEARTLEKDKKDVADMLTWEEHLLMGLLGAGVSNVAYAISAIGSVSNATSSWAIGVFNQIETVETPTQKLLDEYQDNFDVLPDLLNNTIQKLHLGQYRPFGATHVEMNYDTYKYTELIIRSDGKVYTFDKEDIITTPPVYSDIDGDEPFKWLLELPFGEWIKTNFVVVIVILVITIIYLVIYFKSIGSISLAAKTSVFMRVLQIGMTILTIGILLAILLYALAWGGVIPI